MFVRRKMSVNKDSEVLDNIKRDIELELRKRGVLVSGMNIEISTDNISLSIFIKSNRRLA